MESLMYLYSPTSSPKNSPKLPYYVLIENEEGSWAATLLGLSDCKVRAATKEEALMSLRQLLAARLEKAEIVPLDVQPSAPEHPWMKFAGMFEDDPQFDEALADIEAYRRELDAEMEAYHRTPNTNNVTC